jgi:hypothetical protein
MMQIFIPISIGELLDKISILEIKLEQIFDPEKLLNIQKELDLLFEVCQGQNITVCPSLKNDLKKYNSELWNIEDQIRKKEQLQQFDEEFIHLARLVYLTNDKRASIKKQINIQTKSALREEKSYNHSQ